MNEQTIKGKWNEFKGEIRNQWGKITDDELESVKGNVKAIGGLIQQRYADAKDQAKAKFDDLVKRYGDQAADKTEQVKQNLRDDQDLQH